MKYMVENLLTVVNSIKCIIENKFEEKRVLINSGLIGANL